MLNSSLAESATNKKSVSCNKQVNAHNYCTNDTKQDGPFSFNSNIKLYHQNLCGLRCKVNN
jgi:hypothetical protein